MYRKSRFTGTSMNHRFLSYLFNINNCRCTDTMVELYVDVPSYMYIFPTIAHYDSYLIASNCCYSIALHSHSVYT